MRTKVHCRPCADTFTNPRTPAPPPMSLYSRLPSQRRGRPILWSICLCGVIHLLACWAGWLGLFRGPVPWAVALIPLVIASSCIATLTWEVAARATLERQSRARRIQLLAAFAGALTASCWLVVDRYHPCENIMGNHDQGMYLAAAGILARTGSLTLPLPELDALPAEERTLFIRARNVEFMRGSDAARTAPRSLAVGFPLKDQIGKEGPAIPHFPAGFASLIGGALQTAGWPFAQSTSALCIAAGILCLTLFTLKQFGLRAALWFTPLAATHPLFSWLSDRLYAESALFLFVSLAVAGASYAARHPKLAGCAVSLALAGALTVKIDAFLALPACMLALSSTHTPTRFRKTILLVGPVAIGVALGYTMIQSRHYLYANAIALFSESAFVALAVLGAVGLTITIIALPRSSQRTRRTIWRCALGIVALILLIFYAIRSNPSSPDSYLNPAVMREIRSFREDTLIRLDWYWLPLGFLPALGATMAAFHRRISFSSAFLCLAGALSLVILAYDIRCDPSQPFSMRRLVPTALPWLLIGIAACGAAARRPLLRLGCTGLIVAFIAGQFSASVRIGSQPEFPGTWAFAGSLAGLIPSSSIVLVSERSPLSPLAIPLRSVWGVSTLPLALDKTKPEELTALKRTIARWSHDGYRVLYLGNSLSEVTQLGFTPRRLASTQWETNFQLGAYESPSGPIRTIRWNVDLLEIGSPPQTNPARPPKR